MVRWNGAQLDLLWQKLTDSFRKRSNQGHALGEIHRDLGFARCDIAGPAEEVASGVGNRSESNTLPRILRAAWRTRDNLTATICDYRECYLANRQGLEHSGNQWFRSSDS